MRECLARGRFASCRSCRSVAGVVCCCTVCCLYAAPRCSAAADTAAQEHAPVQRWQCVFSQCSRLQGSQSEVKESSAQMNKKQCGPQPSCCSNKKALPGLFGSPGRWCCTKCLHSTQVNRKDLLPPSHHTPSCKMREAEAKIARPMAALSWPPGPATTDPRCP